MAKSENGKQWRHMRRDCVKFFNKIQLVISYV